MYTSVSLQGTRPNNYFGHSLHNRYFNPYSAVHASVLGQDFHPGVIVCLKSPSDYDFPEFGEIIYVLVPDESKLLVVKRLCTVNTIMHIVSQSQLLLM